MSRPTRAELAWALSKAISTAQELYACYCNDTQPCRASEMEKLKLKADKIGEILWRMPVDEILSGKPKA